MILLPETNYDKVINPLKEVSINNLFARSVIEKKVTGKVFVDNLDDPKVFYIVHPYGMSLLFGDTKNADFNNKFMDYSLNSNKIRTKDEWMQAYPNDWENVLSVLYSGHTINKDINTNMEETGPIEFHTRINFSFNKEKYLVTKYKGLPQNCDILRSDKTIYDKMTGTVIPRYFWDTAEDFVNNGIGYSLYCNKELATTAYSAFIHDNKLEIGIETIPEFRGLGFAQLTCSALIDFCIENGYEPVWACNSKNSGSFRLAESLGFEVSKKIPFIKLSSASL